ncbi:unnamed protein product [Eruca vesicaria subsp. sativa]|uniref:Uncharacterized protein n=1 Tax=Eruca vesicaria subsp. sativa TaxID=29727 RepID=A0ABC8LEG1_ERUVS|nr:unnamed protein product [Eruca vesicaria subsp. sativa]
MASKGKAPPPLLSRPPPDPPPLMSPLIPLESLILTEPPDPPDATFTLIQIPFVDESHKSSSQSVSQVVDLALGSSIGVALGVSMSNSVHRTLVSSSMYQRPRTLFPIGQCRVTRALLFSLQDIFVDMSGSPSPKLNCNVSLPGSPSSKPVSIARQGQRRKQSTFSPSKSGQTSTKESS